MDYRLTTKFFVCSDCNHHFKKLVQSDSLQTECEKCGSNNAMYVEPSEFNKEALDRTYRLSFKEDPQAAKEHHPKTDIYNRDPSNIYGEPTNTNNIPRRNVQQQTNNVSPTGTTRTTTNTRQPTSNVTNIPRQEPQPSQQRTNTRRQAAYRPFGIDIGSAAQLMAPFQMRMSPFFGSVRRQPTLMVVTDLFSDFFSIPNQDFFSDNFASNFTSNFDDPNLRLVFMRSMNDTGPSGAPPASKEAIKNLKYFKMTEEYCKKDEKGNLEYPSCSICLMEVEKEQETVLVPCGHMFHTPCLLKWLELHNSCPVCRYELPTSDSAYERQRSATENPSRTPNVNNINATHRNNVFSRPGQFGI